MASTDNDNDNGKVDHDSSSGEVPLMSNQEDRKETKESSQENDYIVPDGGWGWLVTMSAFVTYVILDGSVFSFGVIYVELLEYFNETGGKTAIIGALLYGFPLLLAPFICAFVMHGGFRLVGLIGACLVTTAFILCTIAPNIDFLAVILGLLGSTGMEMGYVSAILCLTYYFDKNRGLATGLAMSGSGVGTFLFPPLLELLLKNYGWHGTCLLIGGVCLNLIPCSLIFRPLTKKTKPEDKYEQFDQMVSVMNGETLEYHSQRRKSKSTTNLPTLRKDLNDKKLHNSDPNLSKNQSKPHFVQPNKFTNSFHHGGYALAFSLTSLNGVKESGRNCPAHIARFFRTVNSQALTILKSTVDWSVLKDPVFLLFGFSNFLLCVYFGLPYLYIPHFAQISGIDEQQASFLVSIMGITSTLSQIGLGWLGDRTKASVQIYIFCMLLGGGSLMMMPIYPGNYVIFCSLCVTFGIGISGNYALTTLILIDLVGLEKLTVAFGMLQLQQGVASLFGTPIGGWIYDGTGSYFWAFMSGGICVVISGLVLLPVPFLMKCKIRRLVCEEVTKASSPDDLSGIELTETKKIEV